MSEPPESKKIASPDYPSLARIFLEASREKAISKLPAGLLIVATPIGHLGDITLRALDTLSRVDAIACEDTRVSGIMLTKYGIKKPLIPYHDHNAEKQRPLILKRIAAGMSVALISDAGLPLIADPGYKLVRACRHEGIEVTVLPGANAAVTALAGSGLPTDQFFFAGFLSPKSAQRQKALTGLKSIQSTLVFHEAPQRLAASLRDMVKIFGRDRPGAIGRELTKLFEETRTGRLEDLSTRYEGGDVKGEITIVVGPPGKEEMNSHEIDALMKEHLQTSSLRDAVDAVSAATGLKRNVVYALALKLTADKAS
jgi:16S rRNA (cytidine1402-2'-O)-methyltransferase